MRPIKRELTADQHADARRQAQIANLAGAALAPLVAGYQEAIISRLVGYARSRADTPVQHIWTALGELAACEELAKRIEHQRKQMPTE